MAKLAAGVLSVLALTAAATSCSSRGHHSSSTPPPSVKPGSGRFTWIFDKTAFDRVVSDPTAAARLRSDTVYELVHGSERPTRGFPVIPTFDFTSYQTMEATINSGSLPSYVRAVMYDSESWSYTPAVEQKDPATYYRMAAQLAHAHKLEFVAAPAVDLVRGLGSRASRTKADQAQAFLDDGVLANAAAGADVIDIQAQRLDANSTRYASFVTGAVSQVKRSAPTAVVLAGLSTCAGGDPSASQLLAAAKSSMSDVSGWWLNVPGTSGRAPGCGSARTAVAIQFVDSLPG